MVEVNSSPGLESIESTTGADVAAAIIEFIEKNATALCLLRRESNTLSLPWLVAVHRPRGSLGDAPRLFGRLWCLFLFKPVSGVGQTLGQLRSGIAVGPLDLLLS